MKRKWLMLVLVLLYIAALSACRGKAEESAATERPPPALTVRPEATPEQETPATRDVSPAQADVLLREDAEGLVSLRIEGGSAEIAFNLEQWDALCDIYGIYDTDRLGAGPFAVVTQGEAVAEACIGATAGPDSSQYEGIVLPDVMLLMEDGRVEYLPADPLGERPDDMYYSLGTLPWLENIEALSWEATGEGIGGTTIYATDAAGVRYDAGLAARYRSLCSGEWRAELDPAVTEWEGYTGTLVFLDDTQLEFLIKTAYDVTESYCGTYRLILSEDDIEGYRKGLMVFDLGLDWTSAEGAEGAEGSAFPRREIRGAYFAEMTGEGCLNLYLAEGDCLYNNQFNALEGPKTEYAFLFAPYEEK